ncbi:hypothetical protein LXA43DRAFT_925115 [Ganoderma leucocontextum]|nr:hypothetical protein LXA43DRAFT_925115 [Ganoderma leucocontextum]
MSPQAKALLCQEILLEIFEYLSPGSPDTRAFPRQKAGRREAQRSLARLARVCRAFSAPALNVLWRVTDDLIHLLSILPSFKLVRHKTYAFTRNATDAEWEHFLEHTQRIREIYTDTKKSISPSVWTFLSRRLPQGQGLLPRLHRLDAFDVAASEHGRIFLLSPTIRHLTMNWHLSQLDEGHLITHTAIEVAQQMTIPYLDSLRVARMDSFNGATVELFPYLKLSHLHTLEIAHMICVERSLLAALLEFPRLRKLTLAIGKLQLGPDPQLSPGFHELRDLRLISRPRGFSDFLQLTNPPNLESLALQISDWFRDAHENIPFVAAALSKITPSVRRFELRIEDTISAELPRFSDLLDPTFAMDHLTHVAIRLDRLAYDIPIENFELLRMAQAWPNLVEFEFDIAKVEDDADPLDCYDLPALDSLVRFAECHPKLVRLTFPYVHLPYTSAAPALDNDNVPLLDHGLQVLRVCLVESTGVPAMRRFAMALDRLFPHLDLSDVGYYDCPSIQYYEHWCDVEQLLATLQAGRSGTHRTPPLGQY